MEGFRVIDRRCVGAAEREFEEQAKHILEVYGNDQEYWFRKYWHEFYHDRPNLLLVDGKTAVMTKEVFEHLPEYSSTLPTGTYFAKRWKRDINEPNRYAIMQIREYGTLEEKEKAAKLKFEDFPPKWWMGEYAEDEDPKQVKIIWREILVV